MQLGFYIYIFCHETGSKELQHYVLEIIDQILHGKMLRNFAYYLELVSFQHYSRMLAKRLIHAQTASMDAEELMINKLKVCNTHLINDLFFLPMG